MQNLLQEQNFNFYWKSYLLFMEEKILTQVIYIKITYFSYEISQNLIIFLQSRKPWHSLNDKNANVFNASLEQMWETVSINNLIYVTPRSPCKSVTVSHT